MQYVSFNFTDERMPLYDSIFNLDLLTWKKTAQKNAREKKRVEVVATTYKQLWAALVAGDENGRRTMKFETLQVAVQFIHDLKELVGLQLLRNEPSEKKR